MAKKKTLSLEVSDALAVQLQHALKDRVESLDKVLASCIKAGQPDAAGKIQKTMDDLNALRSEIDAQRGVAQVDEDENEDDEDDE